MIYTEVSELVRVPAVVLFGEVISYNETTVTRLVLDVDASMRQAYLKRVLGVDSALREAYLKIASKVDEATAKLAHDVGLELAAVSTAPKRKRKGIKP